MKCVGTIIVGIIDKIQQRPNQTPPDPAQHDFSFSNSRRNVHSQFVSKQATLETMAPSPVGIEIGSKWKVGKKLGTGACATVCALNKVGGGTTEFAVKLAPLPKRKTKNGKSLEEKNVSILNYEQMIYQTQFQSLQGTIIPSLPDRNPPISGESNGR